MSWTELQRLDWCWSCNPWIFNVHFQWPLNDVTTLHLLLRSFICTPCLPLPFHHHCIVMIKVMKMSRSENPQHIRREKLLQCAPPQLTEYVPTEATDSHSNRCLRHWSLSSRLARVLRFLPFPQQRIDSRSLPPPLRVLRQARQLHSLLSSAPLCGSL